MISPRTGRHALARRGARVALAFALAFGLISAPHLSAPPAAVADAQEPEDDGAARLSLSAGVHGVIEPGAPLTVTAEVDNDSDDALAAGRVTVELNRTPLATADALTTWLDGGGASGEFLPLGADESDAVPASESSSVVISATASTVGDLAAGVYPLRGSLSLSGMPTTSALTANSVLIVNTDTTRQVTVLVPITATPADGALLTSDELAALTAPDGALTAQLDGVAGTSAVLAIDPLIPAAIRALGSAAPPEAADWLTRLDALSNERFALQPGDADVTVQARAGLPQPLEPLPLTSLLNPANFVETGPTPTPVPSDSASPSPSSSPVESPAAPDEVELPSNAELAEIPGAAPDILWPLDDVQTADLSVFDTYFDTDVTTVLPSTSLAATASALIDVDGHRIMATDAAASAFLSHAAAATDDVTREGEITAAMAQLTYAGAQTSLLIGLDRNETRPAESLRQTVLSLSTVAQPTTMEKLRSGSPASSTLDGEPTDERAASLDSLLADEERLTAFASILDDQNVLLSPERLKVMRLIGVGAAESFAAAVTGQRAATVATLNAVGVQQPSPIQLFTAAAPLPVWVRNDLPWPVNVTLNSRPSDARLDVRPSTSVVAQPASNTRVKVPVEARVGSGELNVRFALYSPTGVHVGTDQTANVTVRAEWESIGLIILGSVIGLLLVAGIIRTIVRRRRAR